MTVIVLDSDDDKVVLAADQLWTDDTDLVDQKTKIQHLFKGNKIIGAVATAGDAKKGLAFEALLVKAFNKVPLGRDPLQTLIKVCEDVDCKEIPPTLLIVKGRGFHIDEEGLILERTRWAIGVGALIALGAMWSRKGSAERLAKFGCNAAIDLTAHCGGPVDVFSMERLTGK